MRGTRGERGAKVGHMETRPAPVDTGLSDLYKLTAECIFLFEKIQGETGNVGQAGLTGWPGHMVIKSGYLVHSSHSSYVSAVIL